MLIHKTKNSKKRKKKYNLLQLKMNIKKRTLVLRHSLLQTAFRGQCIFCIKSTVFVQLHSTLQTVFVQLCSTLQTSISLIVSFCAIVFSVSNILKLHSHQQKPSGQFFASSYFMGGFLGPPSKSLFTFCVLQFLSAFNKLCGC